MPLEKKVITDSKRSSFTTASANRVIEERSLVSSGVPRISVEEEDRFLNNAWQQYIIRPPRTR